jgi:hypothetical protein
MERDPREDETQDADWIFAIDDPHSLPTDRLPSREEFDRYSTPLLARREKEPALPPEPEARTGAIPALGEDGEADEGGEDEAVVAPLARPRTVSYARSGTTPNAEDDEIPIAGFQLPERFKDLGLFDALRDVLALICLTAALTTVFTSAHNPVLDLLGKIAIGVALTALVAVHALRWIPAAPPLPVIRVLRMAGMAPALLVAVIVLGADLVLSLPVLFAPLPDGAPVGIGAGVSLLLLGAILGIEPRAHEGYLPQERARRIARQVLLGVGIAAAAALLLALVMIVGRLFTTGWPFSLSRFADTMVSALLLAVVLASALRRDRSWYVFSTAVAAALAIGALADNSLGLQFAAPVSVATGYVYLPFLFAALGLMISRSFVRSMPLSFRRTDWLVYSVRALELSALMHTAAVLWHLLIAIAATSAPVAGGPVLHLVDAVVCACFVVVSVFGRNALLSRPALSARASGVVASLVLVVVGFLDVIVNSIATASGAGLVTGGVALVLGIATALMLTVPAPVRDEFGAPDITRMFADFRARDNGRVSLLDLVPDVTAATAERKSFPGR